jgi:hypothetical protein
MSNTPTHTSTILDQEAINNAGMAPRLVAPEKPVKPLSMAYWLRVADKEIILRRVRRGSAKGKHMAILG